MVLLDVKISSLQENRFNIKSYEDNDIEGEKWRIKK